MSTPFHSSDQFADLEYLFTMLQGVKPEHYEPIGQTPGRVVLTDESWKRMEILARLVEPLGQELRRGRVLWLLSRGEYSLDQAATILGCSPVEVRMLERTIAQDVQQWGRATWEQYREQHPLDPRAQQQRRHA